MDLPDLAIKLTIAVGSFLGGSLLSLAAAYVMIVKEIAFVKGQLESLLKFHSKLSKLYDKQIVTDKDVSKVKEDLNQAHAKIRKLAANE